MITREIHHFNDSRCPIKCKEYRLQPYTCLGNDLGNWHDELEILTFVGGSATVLYNNREIDVALGDTVIISPNVIHTLKSGPDGVRYICLIIQLDFCIENHIDIRNLQFQILIQDNEIIKLVKDCHSINPIVSGFLGPSTAKMNNKLERIITRRSITLQILTILFCKYRLSKKDFRDNELCHNGIRKALDFVSKESCRDISIDEIAQVAGMSRYYFSREFRKATKYSFVTYLNMCKCENAKKLLLETDMTIADICLKCSFSSQSYFSRVFSCIVGCSPSDFRKQYKSY